MKTINQNKTYRVIDNVLEEGPFEQLQQLMMGNNFNWFYGPHKVYQEGDDRSKEQDTLHNFQFFHPIYRNLKPVSEFYTHIKPLLKKINPIFIHRIKANCTPYSEEIKKFELHTDVSFDCRTAVYYINSNNGYTYFENGEKVKSVANRLVAFPSQMKHAGTTCTDTKTRVVINLNYLRRSDVNFVSS